MLPDLALLLLWADFQALTCYVTDLVRRYCFQPDP
jgi:hypothetical protein